MATPLQAFAERYHVMERIGEGSMGVVHHARDLHTGQSVAIKLLKPRAAEDRRLLQRFVRESEAARRVDHPNVVRYIDSGRWRRTHYAVMELVSGTTLQERVQTRGRLPIRAALELLLQVGQGLTAIHQAGVIHRDIKPANLLLVGPEGGPGQTKIADFGLAKLDHHPVTGSLMAVGTAQYMSPEQALAEPLDGRSDVYALGMVAFFALTGELPFVGKDPAIAMAHQLLTPAPPISWLVDDIRPEIERAIAVALRKDPKHRYDSVESFCQAVKHGLDPSTPALAEPRVRGDDGYRPVTEEGGRVLAALRRELAGRSGAGQRLRDSSPDL